MPTTFNPDFRPTHLSDETIATLAPKPTHLSAKDIRRQWSGRIRDAALFSARTTSRSYLDMVRRSLMAVAGGKVTPQVAETRLRKTLHDLGYSPETGFAGADEKVPAATPGSITDLSSSRRIELILDTNVKQARSLAQIASSEDPMAAYSRPAWKLTRTGKRKKPRSDWKRRWEAAGAACGWKGAARAVFVALKDSPIWAELGKGRGGYQDTVGTSYPPFAFGSGMAWVNVGRREWNEICRREGIDSGDAARLAAARSALKGVVQGDGPKDSGKAAGTMAGMTTAIALPPDKPDETSRKAASAKIAECAADVGKAAAKAKAVMAAIRADMAQCRELACGWETDRAKVEAAARKVKAAEEAAMAIAALPARLDRYANVVAGAAAPVNASMQKAFDESMARYAEAAAKTVAEAHAQAVRMGMAASAVRKTVKMLVFTPDLSVRTVAEDSLRASSQSLQSVVGGAQRLSEEIARELTAVLNRVSAKWPEVDLSPMDSDAVQLAQQTREIDSDARLNAQMADVRVKELERLSAPINRVEQERFNEECADAGRAAIKFEETAKSLGKGLDELRKRLPELQRTADALVAEWKRAECAKAAAAAQKMGDDAESRFEDLQERVNAAKASLRRVRGKVKPAGKSKEERDLAMALTLAFDARSYVRKCMKAVLDAQTSLDVEAARRSLEEMERRRMPYFAKKEARLADVVGVFEAWVRAGAGMVQNPPKGEEGPQETAREEKPEKLPISFPKTLTKDDIAKSKGGIGGTTGARLFTDAGGRRFILKQTNADKPGDGMITAGHLRNEIATDRIYRAAGIKVPECREYEVGGKPVKLSAFVPDAKPLGDYLRTATPEQKEKVRGKLAKGYLVDAVLANWDVAGANLDNILVDADGEPWRIDNGSGMGYRARGIPKKDSEWKNSQFPDEWRTLKDSNSSAFGAMTAHDIFSQDVDWDAVIKATPEADRPVVERRVKEVKQMQARCRNFDAGKFTPEATSEVLEVSYDACKDGLRETVPQTRIEETNLHLMRPGGHQRIAGQMKTWDPYRFADIIIAAAKTINYHAPQKTKPNISKVSAANALKAELLALAATDANAQYYLGILDKIGDSGANSFYDTVGMVERRPVAVPPNFNPPAAPAVSATEKVIDFVEQRTGGYGFIRDWCSAQAGDSWKFNACKAKIFEFEMRGKNPDPTTGREDSKGRLVGKNGELYGFKVGSSEVRINNYKDAWNFYKRNPYIMNRDRAAFRAYKACVQVLLETTDFDGKDAATGTVILGRTEQESVMKMNWMRKGRFGTMMRSGAESHSIFATVCIHGADQLTLARVPYSRISGMYFIDRDKLGKGLFLGDKENEFNCDICNGELEVYYAGTVTAGESLAPYRKKFLAAEKARNGGK